MWWKENFHQKLIEISKNRLKMDGVFHQECVAHGEGFDRAQGIPARWDGENDISRQKILLADCIHSYPIMGKRLLQRSNQIAPQHQEAIAREEEDRHKQELGIKINLAWLRVKMWVPNFYPKLFKKFLTKYYFY